MSKNIKLKKQIVHASDKVTFIIIIIHFMIMTLLERPKLHICLGWKHPLLLNSLLSSHMAHVGSGQWKNISSPCLSVGVFVAFHSLSTGLLGVYILLKTVSGYKNFVLQTLRNIS